LRQLETEFNGLDKDDNGSISKAELREKKDGLNERMSALGIVFIFAG